MTNSKRGFVNVDGIKVDVMIDGMKDLNRAMDGDTVVIQLEAPAKWQPFVNNHIVKSAAKTNGVGA